MKPSVGVYYLSLAAGDGHGEAAYILSDWFSTIKPAKAKRYHNMAVIANYPPACLEKAAKNGDVEAARYLSELHKNGDESMSLPANPDKAQIYLTLKETIEKKIAEKQKKAQERAAAKEDARLAEVAKAVARIEEDTRQYNIYMEEKALKDQQAAELAEQKRKDEDAALHIQAMQTPARMGDIPSDKKIELEEVADAFFDF